MYGKMLPKHNTIIIKDKKLTTPRAKMSILPTLQFVRRIFRDHAWFLHRLLVNVPLKEEALDLYHREVDNLCPRALNEYIQSVDQFTRTIDALLEKKEPIGFIYPSFIKHMLKEFDMFSNVIQKVPMKLEQVAQYLVKHDIDVLLLGVNLLDPSEKEHIRLALRDMETFAEWRKRPFSSSHESEAQWLVYLLKDSDTFDQHVLALQKAAETKNLKSVLDLSDLAILLQHERQENDFWGNYVKHAARANY